MALNIFGSGSAPPLAKTLIENVGKSIEKVEQAVSLPQQKGPVKFSNGNNSEFKQQVTTLGGAAQLGGLMQKLLMMIGLQQLLGGGEMQPAKQLPHQPENSTPAAQTSSSGDVIHQVMQMLQQLIQMIQQMMVGKGPHDDKNGQHPTSACGRPEVTASGKHSQGGVNDLIQQMMQLLMQIMQQLSGGGQKGSHSGESDCARSRDTAQPAQQQGGNTLSKLLGSLLQMVRLDALMSKLGGVQNNGG